VIFEIVSGFVLDTLEWLVSFFEELPEIPDYYLDLQAPIPFLGWNSVASVNLWINASIATVVAMAVGNMMQWLYSLIPMKAT